MRKLFLIILLSAATYSKDDGSVVARIGNDEITARDFKLRLELSPYLPSNSKIDRLSENEFKKDFLYSLLAEILWAKEADRLGFTSTSKFEFYFKPLEELLVRNALFKHEVDDKVKLSAKDVSDAIEKSQFKLHTQIITSTDSSEIHAFFNRIKNTHNSDSLLSVFSTLSSENTEVTLGSLKDENIENLVFALTLNQFAPPVKTEIGWVIFKLKNKEFTPIDINDQAAVNKAKKAFRERRIEQRYIAYTLELLAGTKVEINETAFLFTFKNIWDKLKDKAVNDNAVKYFSLDEWDFETIRSFLNEEVINQSLFSLVDQEITIKDFLSHLAFHGFSVDELDSILVLQKLNRRVKQFVEYQIITKESYKRGLQLSSEVSKDLNLWRQKYLAELYSKSVLDSINITEGEVYDYYMSEIVNEKDIPLLNLRLVTLTELVEVSKIFDLLKEGNNFAEIIKEYGKTDPLVNENGETGLKPIKLLGNFGKIAASLKLDEVYGPINRNNNYSIIQVFEKSQDGDSIMFSFSSLKNELKNGLRFKKFTQQLNESTAALAEAHNVKIYNEVLNKIKITNIPMFLHRFMGFGGRIAGMPLLTPFSEWIDNAKIQKLLP